jgi:hypothetical protein
MVLFILFSRGLAVRRSAVAHHELRDQGQEYFHFRARATDGRGWMDCEGACGIVLNDPISATQNRFESGWPLLSRVGCDAN